MSARILLSRIEAAVNAIDPLFLRSPQFECGPLSARLASQVVLKVETMNPIRCFKGRGADWLISQADAAMPIVCASAGNFGQAMAYSCHKRKIPITIFASVNANPLKVERMKSLGAKVILKGEDFDAAKNEARTFARENHFRFVEDGKDVETAEGAGTLALELLSYPRQLDVLLVPLGNGALLNGVATVIKAKSPGTRVVAVQAAGAPAMIESWQQQKIITHPSVNTIADGIAVREPIAEALADMEHLIDDAVLVSENSILEAIRLIHQHAGLVIEPSGAVGIAALLEHPHIGESKNVATILCGGNMTTEQMRQWL